MHYVKPKEDFEQSYIKDVNSLCEVVIELADELDVPIKPYQATSLLAGILSNTQNFRINTNKSTFDTATSLVQTKKASLYLANKKANNRLTQNHIVWYSTVFNNAHISYNFVYSVINSEEISTKIVGALPIADKVPISRVKGCDVALVLIKLNDQVHGFVQSNSNRFSANSLAKKYEPLGDDFFTYFWSNDKAKDILDEIGKQVVDNRHENGKYAISKDAISKDAISKDTISKDAINRVSTTAAEQPPEEEGKDAISKDAISKDAINRVSTTGRLNEPLQAAKYDWEDID